jgi:hypothetical protein
MKLKRKIALLFIYCFCTSCYSHGWITVKLDTLISISFPNKPGEDNTATNKVVVMEDSTGVYMSGYTVVGFIPQGRDGLDSIYEHMRQGISNSPTVSELKMQSFTINGLTGYEFNYHGTNRDGTPEFARTKGLFINGKLYQCSYSSAQPDKYNLFARKFMQSFTIAKDQQCTQYSKAK